MAGAASVLRRHVSPRLPVDLASQIVWFAHGQIRTYFGLLCFGGLLDGLLRGLLEVCSGPFAVCGNLFASLLDKVSETA